MVPFDSVPISSFHRRLTFSAAVGQFADAYSVGVIGIALMLARQPLGLSSWSMGALAAAALAGVIVGSLATGMFADRLGRRPVFRWSMLIFTVVAALQFRSSSLYELFALRLILGMVTGADYVVGKALVTDYAPVRHRGQILTVLSIAWAAGYAGSYVVGYLLRENGPEAWRLILLTSAAPSLVAFVVRFWAPESALWLVRKGRRDQAAAIIARYLGTGIALPNVEVSGSTGPTALTGLNRRTFIRHVAVGCVLQGSLVVPFYALATFLPTVMSGMGVADSYTGTLIFNMLNLTGAILGIFFVDRISRRTLITRGFALMSIFLAIMIVWSGAPSSIIIALFAAFAFVIAATGNLQFVYPPELFPTGQRAKGIGAIVSTSRIGSASSTFFLPAIVENYGAYAALGLCLVITIFAAIFCYFLAPETLNKRIA